MPPAQTSTAPTLGGSRWNTFPATHTMTARQFFTGAEPLLQGVIDALHGIDREVWRTRSTRRSASVRARPHCRWP